MVAAAAVADPVEEEVAVVVANVPPFHWVVMEEAAVGSSRPVEEVAVVEAPIGGAKEKDPWEAARDNRHPGESSCSRAH